MPLCDGTLQPATKCCTASLVSFDVMMPVSKSICASTAPSLMALATTHSIAPSLSLLLLVLIFMSTSFFKPNFNAMSFKEILEYAAFTLARPVLMTLRHNRMIKLTRYPSQKLLYASLRQVRTRADLQLALRSSIQSTATTSIASHSGSKRNFLSGISPKSNRTIQIHFVKVSLNPQAALFGALRNACVKHSFASVYSN